MTQEEIKKGKEFYDQLCQEIKFLGWSVDLIEMDKFAEKIAQKYGFEHNASYEDDGDQDLQNGN